MLLQNPRVTLKFKCPSASLCLALGSRGKRTELGLYVDTRQSPDWLEMCGQGEQAPWAPKLQGPLVRLKPREGR